MECFRKKGKPVLTVLLHYCKMNFTRRGYIIKHMSPKETKKIEPLVLLLLA